MKRRKKEGKRKHERKEKGSMKGRKIGNYA